MASCGNLERAKKKVTTTKWSPDEIIRFLELFQGYELLWNARHNDYQIKSKRDLALMKLKESLESEGIVVDSLEVLRQKIKTIRNTYRQEHLKVINSKKSGVGTDDVYEPKLIWYKIADSYLGEVVLSRPSTSNLAIEEKLQEKGVKTNEVESEIQEEIREHSLESVEEHNDLQATKDMTAETVDKTTEIRSVKPMPKKRCYSKISRVDSTISKLQKLVDTRNAGAQNLSVAADSTRNRDEYEIFATHLATQMRALPLRSFLKLQEKFQSLITQERLIHLRSPSSHSMTPMLSGMDSDEDGNNDGNPFNVNNISNVITEKELNFDQY